MHDAILVGIGTALNEDPQLKGMTTRATILYFYSFYQSLVYRLRQRPLGSPGYHQPRPVILDTHLRLRPTCKLIQNYQAQKGLCPWVITSSPEGGAQSEWLARKETLESAGASVILVSRQNGKY